jgi:hypothetical protein
VTTTTRPKRILFAGYAPVHFLCFRPIYERLRRDPRVELWLSGGFKRSEGDDVRFDLDGFYDPFGVDPERVIPIERARQEDVDVFVCAHLSDSLFPRSSGATVQIFHGVSFKNLAVRDRALRFDYLCLPGRYHAEQYLRQGLVRPGSSSCLITGFAKADPLGDGRVDRGAVLGTLGLDPRQPTILFAPTGEKHNALEVMGKELVSALCAVRGWNLLVKPHDHPKRSIDWFAELEPVLGPSARMVRDLDVVPYLASADLLVTDASSVAVEYTLMDRPIVFVDVPRLLDHVRAKSPALDLDTYGRRIGVIVDRPEAAPDVVADCLARPDRQQEVRRAMASHVFHAPGRATDNVVGTILYAAGLATALPTDVAVLEPSRLAGAS